MYARVCSQAYKAYACMLVCALKHTVGVEYMPKCWRHTLYALRAYICLTDAYICFMYASGYTIQACSLLDSLLEFKLAVIFCCEPSHGLHDHPPPTPCTQFNESGRRFFYIK